MVSKNNCYYVWADINFMKPSEGGRKHMPTGDGYAPYLRRDEANQDLAVRLYGIPNNSHFGEMLRIKIELTYHPGIDYEPLSDGTQIQLLEGEKIVAQGFCASEILCSLDNC